MFGNFDYTCRRRGVNLHFSTFFRGTTYSTPRGNMFVFMRLIMLQHTLLLHEYWESNSAVEVLGSSLGRSAWTVRKTSIFQRFATQQSFRAPDGVPITAEFQRFCGFYFFEIILFSGFFPVFSGMDVVFLWIRNHPGAMQLLRISLQTIGYRLNHEQIIGYCLIRKRVWSKRPGSGIVLGQCSCFIITSRYIVRPDIQICFSRLIIVFLVPGIFLYKRYCSISLVYIVLVFHSTPFLRPQPRYDYEGSRQGRFSFAHSPKLNTAFSCIPPLVNKTLCSLVDI